MMERQDCFIAPRNLCYISKKEVSSSNLHSYNGGYNNSFEEDIINLTRLYTPRQENSNILSFEEAKERAEAYLKYMGAVQDDSLLWNYDGDIECTSLNFLVYDGMLTVDFGMLTGYFACEDMGLKTTKGLPYYCSEIHLLDNDIHIIDYLPDSEVYVLVGNNTELIYSEFSERAWHINIAHNNLTELPVFNVDDLETFNCSFNNIESLDNSPFATLFNANDCRLKCITSSGALLFNRCSDEMNISNNDLRSLEGIPPVKRLNVSMNINLLSAKGINYAYNRSEKINSFSEINISLTGILNLDYLPKHIYRLNINNTQIKNFNSNTLEYVCMLLAENCNELENGESSDLLRIEDLYLSSCNIKSLKSFSHKVKKIKIDDVNSNSLKEEILFFNENSDKLYNFNYHGEFLRYLHSKGKIHTESDYNFIVESYEWPDDYLPMIKNFLNSIKNVSKFNL